MSELRSPRSGEPAEAHDDEINLLDLAETVLRRWRVVVITVGAFLFVTLVTLLLWPNKYEARTVLLPSQTPSASPVQALASQFSAGGVQFSGTKSTSQELVGVILKSESLADALVQRLNSGTPTYPESDLRRILHDGVTVEDGQGGAIVLTVTSPDPRLTTAIASAYPSLINSVIVRLNTQSALERQKFLREQLKGARLRLEASEEKLIRFQKTNNTPAVTEQARLTMGVASALQEKIMQKEAGIAQLRRAATSDNPELRSAVAEVGQLRAQLKDLTSNRAVDGDVFISMQESPDLQIEATRILREYKRDEQLYVALLNGLAESQVQASNDLPTLVVLDPPEAPTRPVSLPVSFFIALAIVFGGIAGVILSLFAELAEGARHDPANQSFFATWDRFRADLVRIRPQLGRRDTPAVRSD
jgi:uncharacterized protein involved in exopolysaccharide biosynthesis